MGSPPETLYPVVWRISNISDISGLGGLAVSGRWHTFPRRIVYCSDEPFTAYREVLRQVGSKALMPDATVMLEIGGAPDLSMDVVPAEALRPDWASDDAGALLSCRAIGDAWLDACITPLLMAPSVARPGAYNVLINPAHDDAESLRILRSFAMPSPAWAD